MALRKAQGVIDLTAPGISAGDYLAAIHGIADEINDIRARRRWCWVYVKFAAGLNPLITQGNGTRAEQRLQGAGERAPPGRPDAPRVVHRRRVESQ